MPTAAAVNRRNLSLQFNRLIPATAEQVFEAWTNPDLLQRWFVVGRMTPTASADNRIERPQAGAYGVKSAWHPAEQSCVTVRLFEAASGTTLTVDHEGFWSDESLQAHHMVWESSLTKLRELFSGCTTDCREPCTH